MGRLLRHVNVVRDFKAIPINQPTGSQVLTLPAVLTVKDCNVIAYTQDAKTWQVTGAIQVGIK